MEVDRIFYIFGSFARKKHDKRKSLDQSSLSAGNSPLRGKAQRPVSQNLNVAPRTSAYDGGKVLKEWECGVCRKELVEPRLLACLHSFCTGCLQGLHHEGAPEAWSDASLRLERSEPRSLGGVSAGSGYESDLRHSSSEGSLDLRPHKYAIFTRKVSGQSVHFLLCPTCGCETPLPLGGIAALPLNYVLLRRMTAAGRDERVGVLCDLCNTDNKAENRCDQCLVSVCTSCGEAHGKKKSTARHTLQPLNQHPVKYCSQHPSAELNVYCATCQQVICSDCSLVSHCGHALCGAKSAAAERARRLKDATQRAWRVPALVQLAIRQEYEDAFRDDQQAALVESEIASWSEQYRRAVEAHTRAVAAAASAARAARRDAAERHAGTLRQRAAHAEHAARVSDQVLSEAREDELLSLSPTVLRRLEYLTELPSAPYRGSMRLAATAPATEPGLVGRLITRPPDPQMCRLNTDGLEDLRVDSPHDAILELYDTCNERIWCGGEQVSGYFRRRDSRAAPGRAGVRDRGDGTYTITVMPPAPGTYLLAVTLNNNPIKGSPFVCLSRVWSHAGQYHCCAFCSSGGRRDAVCGCGGLMPGGYKGCGHGHAGWPGGRHWSCCGRTARRGACQPRDPPDHPPSTLYQFSL